MTRHGRRVLSIGFLLVGSLSMPTEATAVQIPARAPTLALLSWLPVPSQADGELVDVRLVRNEEPEVMDNWALVTVVRKGEVLEYHLATWWPNGCFGSDDRGWVIQPEPFHRAPVDRPAELIEVSIRGDSPRITLEESGGARIRYTHRCAVVAVDAWIVEVFE